MENQELLREITALRATIEAGRVQEIYEEVAKLASLIEGLQASFAGLESRIAALEDGAKGQALVPLPGTGYSLPVKQNAQSNQQFKGGLIGALVTLILFLLSQILGVKLG